MVKIREGLPLIDGMVTEADSASLTAQLAHDAQHHNKTSSRKPLSASNDKTANWPDDFTKQLGTRKLNSTLDRSQRRQKMHSAMHEELYLSNMHFSDLPDKSKQTLPTTPTDETLDTAALEDVAIDIDAWLEKVAQRISQSHLHQLAAAVDYIKALNSNIKGYDRSSNFVTGVGMADILTYLFQDEEALVAALLYRSAREELISIDDIKAKFGAEIAVLVKDTLAMGQLSETIEKSKRLEDHFNNNQREQLSNIYSMLISVTNDVRVVLIKLAERTFAMRELSFSSEERQKRVAREVMTIYAPLAHRLGIAQLKWELEDLAFRYLAPERYKEIAKLLSEKRSEREDYIERVQDLLKKELKGAKIEAEVSGRVKHIYSIYRKMKLKGLSFHQLYDIRALRVLVNTQAECYYVLGLVHTLWRHIPEQFDDYITNPKSNGYRSLHTAVIADKKSLEVQIRTHQMHFEAELGMCAHVNYKEGGKSNTYLNQRIGTLRQILSINNDTKEHSDNYQLDIDGIQDELDEEEQLVDFAEFERIYVFSRDGDITELPKGATVLDFAYYVHTQVGNRAQAARVNQRYVPLTYQLKTGEQVEIITKAAREPNRDWLVPSLGYIHTSRARSKLRQWFNRQDRDKNVEIGRAMLNKELERLSVHPNSIDLNDYTKHFNANGADDILVGLVTGDIGVHQLTNQISRQLDLEPDVDEVEFAPSVHPKATGKLDAYKINVDGLDNIQTTLAKCCAPVQGEPIGGFITQSNGVSIHNRGCIEYARLIEREPERQIDATWYAEVGRAQPVVVQVEAYDRRGLLRSLSEVIDNENINIRKVDTVSTEDDIAHMTFHIEVSGLSQLSKLLAKLEQQPGIIHSRRAVS